jgi:diguanylate cyclase (GGDEF)-like protein
MKSAVSRVLSMRYFNIAMQIIAGLLIISALYLSSLYSYILFHSLVEIFTIVTGSFIFMIAWNTRRFLDNNYLIFIGISFLFIALIDIAHTLAYKGMGVFTGYDSNLPTQLWIGMRYILALSFLIAPFMMKMKAGAVYIFIAYAALTVLLFLAIFYWNIFPTCYIEGKGLTAFKIVSEYIICFILAASLVHLWIRRLSFSANILRLLSLAIIFSILAEIAFTTYASVYSFANLLGHIFVLISFYLIYKAFIVTGIIQPYDIIFHHLKCSEEELRNLSFIDSLTGLYNRRGFLSVGEKRIKMNIQENKQLVLFYIDLDKMKWINDTLGHSVGDIALIETADTLKESCRENDILARIGGDEFAILAVTSIFNGSETIVRHLNERINILNSQPNRQYELSLSIGHAVYDAEACSSIDQLLDRADKLMYLEKQNKKVNTPLVID